ncbi:MAG: SIS domain-containing protein [Candidatus Bipolaricaulis sp.]|nr:SIS domain-containing protein [Candidatus Bipolaricaulis sp.]
MDQGLSSITNKIKKANFVYIAGNGGSASTANHLANDLIKMCGVKAISLCANEAVVMAYANDDGYNTVFLRQLEVLMTSDDLLITISGSGTSKNIVMAQRYALSIGAEYWSMPTMHDEACTMQEIENIHLQIVHKLTDELCKE